MKLVLLPYSTKSGGAMNIAAALSLVPVPRNAEFKADPTEPTTALNWGRGDYPLWHQSVNGYINNPTAVMNAINKKVAFLMMRDAGVPVPEFTTDVKVAEGWLANKEAIAVICRQELQGREGSGIVVARTPAELVEAKLYTKYAKKKNEYRVHVMKGEVFYANVKTKKSQVPEGADPLIRSGGKHGWFFTHLDPHEFPSAAVQQASIAAVAALGLDFGGVDVGEGEDGVRVYEVNTAPEAGPNTTKAYKAAFAKHYGGYKNSGNVPLGQI